MRLSLSFEYFQEIDEAERSFNNNKVVEQDDGDGGWCLSDVLYCYQFLLCHASCVNYHEFHIQMIKIPMDSLLDMLTSHKLHCYLSGFREKSYEYHHHR